MNAITNNGWTCFISALAKRMRTLTNEDPLAKFTSRSVLLGVINVVGFFAWFAGATKATHVFNNLRLLRLKPKKARKKFPNMKKECHELCIEKEEKEKEKERVLKWWPFSWSFNIFCCILGVSKVNTYCKIKCSALPIKRKHEKSKGHLCPFCGFQTLNLKGLFG